MQVLREHEDLTHTCLFSTAPRKKKKVEYIGCREINAGISKANQALGRLRVRVLNQHNIQLKVYKTVVLASLLYGCETWTLYSRLIRLLERFHTRALRSILGRTREREYKSRGLGAC